MTDTNATRERILAAARSAGRRFVPVRADELARVLEASDAHAEGIAGTVADGTATDGTAADGAVPATDDGGGDPPDRAPERPAGG